MRMVFTTTYFPNFKPDFWCPTFIIPHFWSYFEVITYVQFAANNQPCYGRVYATKYDSDCWTTLLINQFVDVGMITNFQSKEKIKQIQNRYIDVIELVQTEHILSLYPNEVDSMIYPFRKKEIVEDHFSCEGMRNVFVIARLKKYQQKHAYLSRVCIQHAQ